MKIEAKKRELQGTGASRRLRNAGITPGIVYGGNKETVAIELDHNTLWYATQKEAFHSSILDLQIGKTKEKVLLRNVQYHPWKQLILHVDFLRIIADQEITLTVPVHYVGEEMSPAVKLAANLVNYVVTEIEIVCLPADLPEYLTVDLSNLESDAVVHASVIELPKGVQFSPSVDIETVLVTASVPVIEDEAEDEAEDAAETGAEAEDAAEDAADTPQE